MHGIGEDQETLPDAEELGMDELKRSSLAIKLRTYAELARIAEPLLTMLEELATDSKADALSASAGLVRVREMSPDRRVCVFTRFVDTATYLESVLRDILPPWVRVLTGSHSLAERQAGRCGLRSRGRTL